MLVRRQPRSSESVTHDIVFIIRDPCYSSPLIVLFLFHISTSHVPYIQRCISFLHHRPNDIFLTMSYSMLHRTLTSEQLKASHLQLRSSAPVSSFSFNTAVCLSCAAVQPFPNLPEPAAAGLGTSWSSMPHSLHLEFLRLAVEGFPWKALATDVWNTSSSPTLFLPLDLQLLIYFFFC